LFQWVPGQTLANPDRAVPYRRRAATRARGEWAYRAQRPGPARLPERRGATRPPRETEPGFSATEPVGGRGEVWSLGDSNPDLLNAISAGVTLKALEIRNL
jgi:hypothetical protein